jgi:tetraacyldisaccharide 4'-kinase
MLCDDGLQHYRLPRDIELAVFDSDRGLGNGALIPVGPLRELPQRLESVDFVITNGGPLTDIEHPHQYPMALEPKSIRHLATGREVPLADINGKSVLAVAGIGNPGRFFDTLRQLGATVTERPLPDHHRFKSADLQCDHGEQWLVMTAKDEVKCRDTAPENAWVLDVEAKLPAAFEAAFLDAVEASRESI